MEVELLLFTLLAIETTEATPAPVAFCVGKSGNLPLSNRTFSKGDEVAIEFRDETTVWDEAID